MKISKTKLRQIIKEEVTFLVEAPITTTKVVPRAAQRRAAQRDKARGAEAETVPVPRGATGDAREREPGSEETRPYGGKVLSPQDPVGGEGVSIGNFSAEVIEEILSRYAKKEDITIGPELGSGVFGIVYKVEGPSGFPEALKVTVEAKEYNAYKEIDELKNKIASKDENVATALPTIYDMTQIVSVPLEYKVNARRFVPALGDDEKVKRDEKGKPVGETYRFYLIRMELLEPVTQDIRSDVFGPSAWEPHSDESRERFIDNYLSLDNLTTALEAAVGEEAWERLTSYISNIPLGRGPGIWPEMDKLMGVLKKAYLESDPDNHFSALSDVNELLSKELEKLLTQYIDDEGFLRDIQIYLYMFLWQNMAANLKLPQYDPEHVEASAGLRAQILQPGSMQSQVAKNFYNRLKGLEKYEVQYGDVHPSNLMMRENGDLVVADVGLFLFGPAGARQYASAIVERYRRLAGLI